VTKTTWGFWFDRNIPIRVARVIGAYEPIHLVRHQDDDLRVRPTSTDIEILTLLGNDPACQWSMVTSDRHIRTRPDERQALRKSGVKYFVFDKAWSRKDFHEQTWRLLKSWPDLVRFATEDRRTSLRLKACI
jgi:hypothetical protein